MHKKYNIHCCMKKSLTIEERLQTAYPKNMRYQYLFSRQFLLILTLLGVNHDHSCAQETFDFISNPDIAGSMSNSTRSLNANTQQNRPNLIMIMTDEHNLRTLGCYRDFWKSQNQSDQAFVWGEGIEVETPNIDKLAAEGALFTNFYTVAPLCTPSRASFMSGKYPQNAGTTAFNHGSLDDDVVTFANVLKTQQNYYTGYFGKWHLNGKSSPGWGNDQRKFGFEENQYQYNRGHWKFFDEVNENMIAYKFEDKHLFAGQEEKHFSTDFLFDRSIEFMDAAQEKNQPFAFVLSIPDPHAPNNVREPYKDMYKNITFKLPRTAYSAARKNPGVPGWHRHHYSKLSLGDVDAKLKTYEESKGFQTSMQQYFGMIKCIDDNVGKLLHYLNVKGLEEDTIVVFTSDHGSMAEEHGSRKKGRPYRSSAGIPFIIRYPAAVKQGKVIETAWSSIDFSPSILSLMNIQNHEIDFDGDNFADELLNQALKTDDSHVVYTFDTGKTPIWASVVQRELKLVVSSMDAPWLFDLKSDPDELINFIDHPDYMYRSEELLDLIYNEMHKQSFPLTTNTKFIYWSTPECFDSKDRIKLRNKKFISCRDLTNNSWKCNKSKFQKLCPETCTKCCKNSMNKPIWINGELKYCEGSQIWQKCRSEKVQKLCPTSCKRYTGCEKQ